MPLEIVVGDILENQSEVLVMPLAPRKGRLSEFAKTVYNAAGYDNMKKARDEIGKISKGKAAYTSGFDLSATHVVHVSVPEWFGGFSDEPKYLSKCYYSDLWYYNYNIVRYIKPTNKSQSFQLKRRKTL